MRGKALVGLIERYLREGAAIEVDGLGSFQLNANNCVVFEPNGRIRVFLAYAEEDRAEVTKLYYGLREAGFENISIEPTRVYRIDDARAFLSDQGIDVDAIASEIDGRFMSAFIRASKPQ